jgi:hypothetical protein
MKDAANEMHVELAAWLLRGRGNPVTGTMVACSVRRLLSREGAALKGERGPHLRDDDRRRRLGSFDRHGGAS